jgi:hypothetical protein
MKYWEIIADNLSNAGWSWRCAGRSMECSLARKIGNMTRNYSPDSPKAARGCSTPTTEWQHIGN